MTDAQVTTAIAEIATGTPNTALELRTLFTELFNRCPKTGTIVMKDVSNTYITANFDGTGLGINLESGYALVNGANGTRNWAGRVPIAYGTGYTTMGESLGSKDAVVVEHEHTTVTTTTPSSEYNSTNKNTAAYRTSGGDSQYGLQGTSLPTNTGNTDKVGVSGENKNMQPYIVTLVTMKL